MSSAHDDPLVMESEHEITVHLQPALPENCNATVQSFLRNLRHMTHAGYLGTCFAGFCIKFVTFYLLGAKYDANTVARCFALALWIIPLAVIPALIYNAVWLPSDYTLTLSASSAHMYLNRLGCMQRDIVLPLDRLISFKHVQPIWPQSWAPCFIVAKTTDHCLLIGASVTSYGDVVERLNSFLRRHRQRGTIPDASIVLPTTRNSRPPFPLPSPKNIPRSPLSRLTFRRVTQHMFTCAKRVSYFGRAIFELGVLRLMYTFTPLRAPIEEIHRRSPWLQLIMRWTPVKEIGTMVPLAAILQIWYSNVPQKWVFTKTPLNRFSPARLYHFLTRTSHIALSAGHKILVVPSRGQAEAGPVGVAVCNPCVETVVYEIKFVGEGRKTDVVKGFSHDETMLLLVWLNEHFPRLVAGGERSGVKPAVVKSARINENGSVL